MQLPNIYISWSQLDLWERDKKGYRAKYFFRQESPTNAAMEYGKYFAEEIEKETEDKAIQKLKKILPTLHLPEHEISTVYQEIPLIGRLDTCHEDFSTFREYKTGKIPWNQKRAEKHGQLPFYACLIYLSKGIKVSKAFLDYIPTEDKDGQIHITGKVHSFEVEIRFIEILKMQSRIKKAAQEISNEYSKFLTLCQ